ncbi:MAG TPA: hypothetical protein DDY77_04270 [Clostridiales bacterium]|nr:hypothetical protein [Clostridiales bacterium]
MKIEKLKDKIVCDVPGCGNLAEFRLTFDGKSASFNLCRSCFSELKKAVMATGGKNDERK